MNAAPHEGGSRLQPVRRLLAALPQGEFFRGAITIAGATGAAQLIGILSSPIITRLYSPADYGAFAVAGALLTLLVSVACLRYELAIPLPRSDVEAANVLAVCLVVCAAISLGVVPLLWLAGPRLMGTIGAGALAGWVLLLPVGVLAGGALAGFIGWMLRTKSYTEIAANRLAQSSTVVAVQVGLGLFGAGASGLLLGTVAGSLAGMGRLIRAAWRRSHRSFREVRPREARAAATRYRRFPIFSAPSIAINILGLDVPLVWIVATYGAGTGGQFALAQRVVALPIAVLAAAVGQVYFAEAARLAQERPAGLRGLFTKTTRTLVLAAIGPFALGAVASPSLFPVIFGQAWSDAGLYVAILAPMYLLQFVSWPTGGTLDVLERQDLHLLRETGRLILVGGVVVIASLLRLSAIHAVIALSVAGCVMNTLYGLVSWRAIVTFRLRPVAVAAGTEAAMGDTDDVLHAPAGAGESANNRHAEAHPTRAEDPIDGQ